MKIVPLNNLHLNEVVSEKISLNTVNTWQSDRSKSAKSRDTSLGKVAESVIENEIEKFENVQYLPYDDFRQNNFKKHAPFDGLLCSKDFDKTTLEIFLSRINNEISSNTYGKISEQLKSDLEKASIFTVEIKSTRITSRHRKPAGTQENIIANILKDDFLEYPKYMRTDKLGTITSLEKYFEYVKKKYFANEERFSISDLRLIERNNMRVFYIRIYVDEEAKICYIPGFTTKKNFSKSFNVKHMPQINKSEKAIYLSLSLIHAEPLEQITRFF